ncbi:MAG: long-chain fatty acid--CoA ligase [Nitrospirae bacterium]|nr:long-chain fatty acid--CoA ligase [Nitrospirota bacterium]
MDRPLHPFNTRLGVQSRLPAVSRPEIPADRPWLAHYAPGVPHHIKLPGVPLTHLLANSVKRHPQRPAMNFYGNRIPFAKLDDLASRFANALVKLGARKGDRVAIMLPNLPQAVIGYYGVLKAGCVVVQTNPLYQSEELAQQVRDAGARFLLALDLFKPRVRPIVPGTPGSPLEAVIYCNVRDYLPPFKKLLYPFKARLEGMWAPVKPSPREHDFVTLMNRAAVTLPNVHLDADDVALLQYTGGTTGIPKGVILTHRNLVANTLQCQAWLPDVKPGQERFLAVLPFFHVYGMTTCMNLAVAVGGELILLPKFSPSEVLKVIDRHKPTLFPGIQAMYLSIGNHPDAGKYDLKSIRACISGAGPLHADVRERFEALTGANLVEGYGLSEAAPVTHANPIGGEKVNGAIGLPFPDTDAKIVDGDTGNDLPVGQVGELLVRGPQVMKGYWNRSEETLATLAGGWLHTGDMGRMDERGFFYLVDRKKDMIKTGGENVYPRDVEEVLFRHPKVHEAIVAGLPDDFLGEKIKAYVVLNHGETATPEEIIDFCAEHLAKFKVPREVQFRTELPKNIVGKVLRRMLMEEERKGAGTAPPEGGKGTTGR